MSKMKSRIVQTHMVRYTSKDIYEFDEYTPILKASFIINEEKKHITCKLRDDRFELFMLSLMFEKNFTDKAGTDILVPTYYNIDKLKEYYSIFINENNEFFFTGKARCHPEDTFNIQEGKQLALARALDKRDKAIQVVLNIIQAGVAHALGGVASNLRRNVNGNTSIKVEEALPAAVPGLIVLPCEE